MKNHILAAGAAFAIILSTVVAQPAFADSDPFPDVPHMGSIPGTRISSAPGQSQVDFDATPAVQAFSCPEGSGRGIGVDLNSSASQSDHVYYYHCVKTWQPQSTVDAWANYRAASAAAFAAAEAESKAWNEAHPGQQKCVQWGPLTDPNGGTSSGGVCANPVPAAPGTPSTDAVDHTPTSPSIDTVDPVPAPVMPSTDAVDPVISVPPIVVAPAPAPVPEPEPIGNSGDAIDLPIIEPIDLPIIEPVIPISAPVLPGDELVIFAPAPVEGNPPWVPHPNGYLYPSKLLGLYYC